jgi:exodeoxyribonuclease VII small subunit
MDIQDIPQDIQSMTFEQAMAELEETVRRLETGKITLDESVTVYTRGTQLKYYCDFKLNEASAKIEKLIIKKDGTDETVPFEG